MTSRRVTFAGRSVRIDCDGLSAVRLAGFLFGDLPASDAAEPHVTLSVEMDRPDGVRALHEGDTRLYRGDSETALARALLDRTLYHLSDRIDSGLVIHAAAVTRAGRCLLLPGKSGAGKTTLTTWLVAQGFEYLTDELVSVPLDSSTIVPFRRPLNVRSSARPVLAAQGLDVDGLGTDQLTGRDFTMIRLAAQPAVVSGTGSSLTAIVLPSTARMWCSRPHRSRKPRPPSA